MSHHAVISVENLGKTYRISHRSGRQPYVALRDVIADRLRGLFVRRNPPPHALSSTEEFWALRNVSLEVKQGEVIGIIGRNGAGKSTLLKILSRITEPSEGRVRIKGRVASLLEVGTGFHPELTGRENIYLNGAILGMSRAEIKKKFDEIVAFAEVEKFLDTPVKSMYVRLAFAVAAHLEPEILIIDEVLAVGDAQFQKKCLGKMSEVAQGGKTVLFVSHNLGTVFNLCRRCVVLEKGQVACNEPVKEAVEFYHRSLFQKSEGIGGRAPHVLFDASSSTDSDLAILKIELFDDKGQPKPLVGTWESVTFRLWYRSRRKIARGSVVLQISSLNNVTLILLSTEPDGTLPLDLLPGEHAVDCVIESLPLSSGDYTIGAGLALPNVEMLWWQPELATLSVNARDVFGSGQAPVSTRALIAPHHFWRHGS
jgi:lipopolysaccharide transport system ATP-binding protein